MGFFESERAASAPGAVFLLVGVSVVLMMGISVFSAQTADLDAQISENNTSYGDYQAVRTSAGAGMSFASWLPWIVFIVVLVVVIGGYMKF